MARKAKFASGREKKGVIIGSPLNPNMSVAYRYEIQLMTRISRMIRDSEREIKTLFRSDLGREFFAMDDTLSAQAKFLMNALTIKFTKLFADDAPRMAKSFINDSEESSAVAMKSSLQSIGEGLTIKSDFISGDLLETLNASVTENVALIKSIPAQYFQQIQGSVMRSITNGTGLHTLVPDLMKYEGTTRRRARIIATDQTRKAFSNINRIRAENLGIKQFKWLHSSAGHEPRPLHKNVLNGKTFDMDNPPVIDEKTGERGFPGQLINCRCRLAPVISFGEE